MRVIPHVQRSLTCQDSPKGYPYHIPIMNNLDLLFKCYNTIYIEDLMLLGICFMQGKIIFCWNGRLQEAYLIYILNGLGAKDIIPFSSMPQLYLSYCSYSLHSHPSSELLTRCFKYSYSHNTPIGFLPFFHLIRSLEH